MLPGPQGAAHRRRAGVELIEGDAVTECELPFAVVARRGGYCRVTVEDAGGARAWSNPIHLRTPDTGHRHLS